MKEGPSCCGEQDSGVSRCVYLFDCRAEGEVPEESSLPPHHLNGNHHTVLVGSGCGLEEG